MQDHGGYAMSLVQNTFSIYPSANYRLSQQKVLQSMSFLSSGKKLTRPGDGPAEFGIAQNFRYQINNSSEAMLNIQNARGMIASASSWLQNTQEILTRMGELATAAADGSKNQGDRENLDLEFQQLKNEIARIASDAKYNGVQVAGRDAILTFDKEENTFRFAQPDGSQQYTLPKAILSGISSVNGIDYKFSSTQPYTLSGDGCFVFYIDDDAALNRYEINTGVVTHGQSALTAAKSGLEVDNTGRLWYLTENTGGSAYTLRLQDVEAWETDTTPIDAASIEDIQLQEFKVYNERIYYYDTEDQFVSRNLLDINDKKVLFDNTTASVPINTNTGKFAFSESGQLVVDEIDGEPGVLRVTNLNTGKFARVEVGESAEITQVRMSADGNRVVYLDTADQSIRSFDIHPGEQPEIINALPNTLMQNVDGYAGVSLDGVAHRSNFLLQNGPNYNQSSVVNGGDVRLYTLGLLNSDIKTIESADSSLSQISQALDRVSLQMAKIGSQDSRLGYTYLSLDEYQANISNSESLLRDVNVAEETSKLAMHQLLNEINLSLLQKASQLPRVALRLLQ